MFALEEQPEKLNFKSILAFRNHLVASFSEALALTFRNYIVEQGLPT